MARTYIAVAGNIGAGKSTLVDWLCKTYGIQPFFEPNEANPYLEDFYDDMLKWGFHSQVFFLSHKFRIHQELDAALRGTAEQRAVVQDRTIYEDAEIFAAALHAMGNMTKRDYQTYRELYETICHSLKPPDLMIYLRCPLKTLKKRIKLRGRAMEQDIPSAYLKRLDGLYEAWFDRYPHERLVIDTGKLDYLSDLVDRLDVMKQIERYLPASAIKKAVP